VKREGWGETEKGTDDGKKRKKWREKTKNGIDSEKKQEKVDINGKKTPGAIAHVWLLHHAGWLAVSVLHRHPCIWPAIVASSVKPEVYNVSQRR